MFSEWGQTSHSVTSATSVYVQAHIRIGLVKHQGSWKHSGEESGEGEGGGVDDKTQVIATPSTSGLLQKSRYSGSKAPTSGCNKPPVHLHFPELFIRVTEQIRATVFSSKFSQPSPRLIV